MTTTSPVENLIAKAIAQKPAISISDLKATHLVDFLNIKHHGSSTVSGTVSSVLKGLGSAIAPKKTITSGTSGTSGSGAQQTQTQQTQQQAPKQPTTTYTLLDYQTLLCTPYTGF